MYIITILYDVSQMFRNKKSPTICRANFLREVID
jgi:hypothetical protein